MMSKSKIEYVFHVPIHNSAPHNSKTVPGTSGFRAWLDVPYHEYAICARGWAPHLGTHYCEASMKEEA
jgi:hypothetical protein